MQENIDIIDETKIPLRRILGVTTAILLVAGNMIGTGVFKKIVPMAQTGLNHNYILLAWIAAGFITLLGSFTIAGLAQLTTASGGAYEYMRICYGSFISYLFGWTGFIILGSGSIAAIGFIFSQSINSLVAIPDPLHQWSNISVGNFIHPFADSGIKIFAIITIGLLTWFNYRGVKNSTIMNNIITSAKILGILFLILGGLIATNSFVANAGEIQHSQRFSGTSLFTVFFGAMLSAFWAYDGFLNVSAVTGEIKNPKRNVPIAVISGVIVVMILYVILNYAFMKIMPLNQLASLGENKIAATEMAGFIFGKKGIAFISVLIMLSSFGTLNVMILFYSRLYYRMAQENVFFKNASKVHPAYRTPYIALIYSMVWSCILVLSGTFDILTNMVVFAGFSFYPLLAWGLIKMKRKKIIADKIPAYPVAPVLFILLIGTFLINTFLTNTKQTITGIILILTGIPFYFLFKQKNSVDKKIN